MQKNLNFLRKIRFLFGLDFVTFEKNRFNKSSVHVLNVSCFKKDRACVAFPLRELSKTR